MKYKCPVCGYKELSRPPQDDTICPCCGTHFGYHDFATSPAELRARWISRGAPWFNDARAQPSGWDPWVQLWESGLGFQFQNEGTEDADTETHLLVELADIVAIKRGGTSA